MKQLLSILAMAILMVACGPEKKETSEEATTEEVQAIEVEVATDSLSVEATTESETIEVTETESETVEQ
jgi:PBP1b-binding outer membrane lipoprotein LpoB